MIRFLSGKLKKRTKLAKIAFLLTDWSFLWTLTNLTDLVIPWHKPYNITYTVALKMLARCGIPIGLINFFVQCILDMICPFWICYWKLLFQLVSIEYCNMDDVFDQGFSSGLMNQQNFKMAAKTVFNPYLGLWSSLPWPSTRLNILRTSWL